jgi:arylsulfatase A-like enzyme
MAPTSILACALFLACDGAGEPPPDPPNLLLVVVDTLRADRGGGVTPAMDRLAAESVSFPLAFSHAPMTLPSHVALFSSRLPHQTGVLNNCQPVPTDLPLLAEHLRAAGYQTHGVTSLGTVAPLPNRAEDLARGFDTYRPAGWGFISPAEEVYRCLDEVLDSLQRDAPFFLFAHFSDPHEPYNQRHGEPERAELLLDGRPVDTLTSSVMTVYEERLWMSPGRHRLELRGDQELRLRRLEIERDHVPLETEFVAGRLKFPASHLAFEFDVPGEEDGQVSVSLWLTDHARRAEAAPRYASEVGHVDAAVGALLDALRARGLYDDTLVVLTSDHGESLGERRFIGHVKALYDELIHVPLMVRVPPERPGRAALAAHAGQVVGLVDVVPTVLELLDLPALEGQCGRSLLAEGRAPFVVAETHPPEAPRHLVCVRDADWKLVYDAERESFELFDLAADPGEREDVFELRGDVRPHWPELLRACALHAADVVLGAEPVRAETAEMLAVLGYLE